MFKIVYQRKVNLFEYLFKTPKKIQTHIKYVIISVYKYYEGNGISVPKIVTKK